MAEVIHELRALLRDQNESEAEQMLEQFQPPMEHPPVVGRGLRPKVLSGAPDDGGLERRL